jgi:PiT family inorganic phosphate transporter
MWLSILLLVLTFLATMLVAGNNLSVCVGPAVGSRILTKRFGTLLGALGFSAGLLLQGSGMTRSVGVLLPNASAELRAEALLGAVLVFVAAGVVRVPLSLNMSLVGLLAGLSTGESSTGAMFTAGIVLMWVAAPIAAFALAVLIVRYLSKDWPKDLWRRLQTYKILLIVLSFSSAYVLGANTLGLVVATGGFDFTSVTVAVAAVFAGSFLFSGGAIRRVSEEFFLMRYPNAVATLATSTILVELATVFNIPLSNTQTTAAAVFGTGISYKTKLVSVKPFLIIVAGWFVAPLLTFVLGVLMRQLPF